MSDKKPEILQEIFKLLALYRKKAHLTQKQIAERMGISVQYGESYISRLEKGKITNPRLETIMRFLDAYEIP